MFYGELKFRELLNNIKEQSERVGVMKLNSLLDYEIDKLNEEIKNTENKLIELFMLRYNK